MHCSKCGSDNVAGARFCNQCATPLGRRCSKCGYENAADARFCAQCAAALDSSGSIPSRAAARDRPAAERRHLTILICDLVGSTAIASQLDPEQWRETVADYHRAVTAEIIRFGGHVAQYLGDGVMAYFGWPEAHDNDAERAARAGLAIFGAIAGLNEQRAHPKLSARVGVDSGTVVVGAGAGKEADVFGDAPNIAARVQVAAEPGTVLVTAATYRLISGMFVVEDRGVQVLKGIERPIQLYRVIRPSGVRGRLEAAAAARGLTSFVGREDELRSLTNRWERVLDGEGQVALIIGEAGIGKSRLMQRFREQIAGAPHSWVEAAAGPFFQNTPFHAVTEMLHELLAWEERLVHLEMRLAPGGEKSPEATQLIAPTLNPSLPEEYPPLTVSSGQQRRRLLATLVERVLGAARAQALVIAIEDLHWADPSTLELIQLLVEQGAAARLLLLFTARPEFRPSWPLRAHHTQLTLNRLDARAIRTMVAQVAAAKALSDETVATVVERTGGVPLFVEELTRVVLESGNLKLTGREIPVTLHDSLMARLDRLGSDREVAQVGAVIGGEFSYELLRAVHPIAEEDLQHALRRLADAELLYVRGIAPAASYKFKHALIRDAAYEALLKSRRRELHRRVARTIDEKFPTLRETQPELLARHWAEAGETDRAISAWSRAGTTAYARGAFVEALEGCQQAVALLKLLPETPERDSRELELTQTVFSVLWATRGVSAPETIGAAERAAALAENAGNLTQLGNWMRSRCLATYISGDLSAAAMLADQALDLAVREGGATSLGRAHILQMLTRHWRGDLVGAERHFTEALRFFGDPGFSWYPGGAVAVFAHASWNSWMLGRADLARERAARMMAAASGKTPYDNALSQIDAAHLCVYMREYDRAQALSAPALELAEKHHFGYLAAFSRCLLGHTHAQLGCANEGIGLIQQGLAGLAELGIRIRLSNFMAHLAEGQERIGAIADAIETVERALGANPDERVCRSEILKLRGELRLKQADTELAEDDFREAISFAREMGAKSWELRATMSLARLLRDTGRREEARAILAGIYNWFTEGFDTADLKDAKTLLQELSE